MGNKIACCEICKELTVDASVRFNQFELNQRQLAYRKFAPIRLGFNCIVMFLVLGKVTFC